MPGTEATFPKTEKLCGKTAVSALVSHGKWGSTGHLKYCFLTKPDATCTRVLISVPKRFFKRAVKRNLLKRRIREAYRTQKQLATGVPVDLMIQYNCAELMDFDIISREVAAILSAI